MRSREARIARLEARQHRQAQKGPPRPWFGFSMEDGGPGESDGWVETRTMEEAIAEGAPVFLLGFLDEDGEGE
jgi:hypothetical protein